MYISTIVILMAVALSNFIAKFVSSISKTYISLFVGIIFAAIPLVNGYILKFDYEFFMAFIIAPLLFLEGQKTRSILVRRKLKSIIGTAVVLALISAIASLFLVSQLFSLTLPFALILIAISTPTDATAMDSVSEGRKMPRRSEIVLKMESLFNDASGIILLQAGVIWFKTGHLSYASNFGAFILTAVGGALVGFSIAFIIMICRQMIIRTRFNVTHSHLIVYFATPVLIYFAAEELKLSGIIAVVSAGLIFNGEMSRSRFSIPRYLSFFNQIVDFIADTMNGFVFVILGLSLMRIVIEGKPELTSTLEWLWIGVAIYLISLVIRYLYAKFGTRYSQIEAITFSLGGVHGAVTLALVFSLVKQGISTHLFNLILLTETVVIILSMLTPTIVFKLILNPIQNQEDMRMNKKLVREKMVEVGIEYVSKLQISPAVKESVTFDLMDQNRNTTLRQFLSQWLGVNSKRYVFIGYQAVEERQILMNAFEEERKYLYDLVDGAALEKAKYIYDVYSELLISESLVLDSYEE